MLAGSRRGITPVIAIALLLGMTVAASGGAYTFFTTATQQGMDEASASLNTELQVRSARCEDTSATIGISNTGDRELAAESASVFLYDDGALVDTISKDVSGADVLQPGGFSELEFPFTTFLEPGTRYTVEVSFDDADYSFERPCQGQSGSLIGYWNFDAITSRTITDLAGDNDGTFNGMDHNGSVEGMPYNGTLGSGSGGDSADPAWTSGCKMGGCLSFDGGDRVVADSPSFPTGNASRTITAWAKLDSGNDNTDDKNVAGYGGPSTGTHFGITYGLGSSYCWGLWGDGGSYDLWSDDSGCAPGHVELDRWYHLAIAYDGNTQYLYIDGELANSQSVSLDTAATDFEIGSSPSSSSDFPGDIDDVRVYDRALSGTEVESVMDGDLVPDGLVAYYPLDEGSGQTAWNGAFQVEGQHGQAASFDGTDDRIRVPNSAPLRITGEITLEAWVKTGDATSTRGILDTQKSGSNGYRLAIENGNVEFGIYGEDVGAGFTELVGQRTVSDGEWHHVAGTWDGSTMTVYVDGEADGTATQSGLAVSSQDLFLGVRDVDSGWFNGSIDDVRVYNRSLPQSEVQDDMAGGPPKSGIVAYYSFDDPAGRTTWNSAYWQEGKDGGAVTFQGLDSGTYIDLGADDALNPSRFSVGGWVRPYDTGYAYNYLFSNARDCCGPYDGIDFRLRNGQLELKTWNSSASSLTSPDTFTDGEWLHVMTTYNGSTMKLYEDGQLVQSVSNTDGIGSPASFDTYIGTMGYNPPRFSLNGTLDDMRLYGAALSAQQIAALYNATR